MLKVSKNSKHAKVNLHKNYILMNPYNEYRSITNPESSIFWTEKTL